MLQVFVLTHQLMKKLMVNAVVLHITVQVIVNLVPKNTIKTKNMIHLLKLVIVSLNNQKKKKHLSVNTIILIIF